MCRCCSQCCRDTADETSAEIDQDGFGDEQILIEGDQDEHNNVSDNKQEFQELRNEQAIVVEVDSDANCSKNDATEELNGFSNVNIEKEVLVELPNDEGIPIEADQGIHDIVNDNKKELKQLPNEQAVVVEAVSYTHLTLPTICSV